MGGETTVKKEAEVGKEGKVTQTQNRVQQEHDLQKEVEELKGAVGGISANIKNMHETLAKVAAEQIAANSYVPKYQRHWTDSSPDQADVVEQEGIADRHQHDNQPVDPPLQEVPIDEPEEPQELRRSTRRTRPPDWYRNGFAYLQSGTP
ncbi:hypothetical protein MAR_021773 [Mya arenaria]|uniref:Uncharacterized protein n=1 Tax=Mya arenaria TaxID=6604 RepID=A0ABY7EB53_MYAAR|nr:hypothetical protein MAR_021773 [Mya arenaria]